MMAVFNTVCTFVASVFTTGRRSPSRGERPRRDRAAERARSWTAAALGGGVRLFVLALAAISWSWAGEGLLFTPGTFRYTDSEATSTPGEDSFKPSLFTGAATYSIPIEVPAGAGGMQPSVALTYNSRRKGLSVGYAGKGWSVELPKIVRSTKYGADKAQTTEQSPFGQRQR